MTILKKRTNVKRANRVNMPAPVALVPLIKGLLGAGAKGALAGAGRSALMTGVRAGARGGIRQGIKAGVRQGARNTMRGGVMGGGRGGDSRGGRIVRQTNDSAIVRSENGGLAVPGRTIQEGGALTSSLGPTSQKSTAIVKTGPSKNNVLGLLEQIKKTTDQILEVEVKELDNDNKEYKKTKKENEKERKLLEAEKRDEEEEKQEANKAKKGSTKPNPVVKAAKKGIGNVFQFLIDLFKDFVLYKILDWIGDPKNRKKVQQLVKFIGIIPGALKHIWKHYLEPWWEFTKKLFGGGFKIFMSLFNVVKDLIELKWLTNPGEFFQTLMEVPKTLIEVIPGIIGSLLNAITGGAISKIGDLVSGLFNNPLKGIDLGNVGSLLGSAANFVKGLLGNAWTGITNAVGGLFGGGGTTGTPKNMQGGGRGKSSKSAATSTPKPDKPSQPPATKPITKTSGTADLGDKNYGVKVNAAKSVELDGKKYIFTRKKDGWSVQTDEEVSTSRGTKIQRKTLQDKDVSKVEGLVAAFDKEHGGMDSENKSDSSTTSQSIASTGTIMGNPVLTSEYGKMRGSKAHGGTDIAARAGSPLVAVADAEVVDVGLLSGGSGDPGGWGNFVVYKENSGLHHLYGHMLEKDIAQIGQKVKSGEMVGRTGSTGRSEGPHLHWETGTGWTGGVLTGKSDPLSHYNFKAPYTSGAGQALAAARAGGLKLSPSTEPSNLDAPPGATTPSPKITRTPSPSGSNLGSVQRESRSLSSGGSKGSSPTVINNSSSTQSVSEQSEGFSGNILPSSGLWAIYSYQL